MRREHIFRRVAGAATLALLLGPTMPVAAQGAGAERIYAHSQGEVENALAKIRPSAKGRLPTLDGFVGTTEQPLESYTSGYYECSIKLSQASSGGTLVRVVAKVTAWYTDSNPARSGYRTLPSNGRLETDLLDRLGAVLDPGGTEGGAGTPGGDAAPAAGQTVPSGAFRVPAIGLPDRPTPNLGRPGALPGVEGGGSAGASSLAGNPGNAPDATEGERAEAEKKASELQTLAGNLEEILRNQAHPDNLAAVRKSGTPVYARPESKAQVLFSAEAQDEFPILEVQPAWVHLQISGVSRGWIRRAELELPAGFMQTPGKNGEGVGGEKMALRVSREAVTKYPADWQPLRGKMVKVFYVQPEGGAATSARQKLEFAKALLMGTHADATPGADTATGVVVVFDSADGGQISATLADVKELQAGQISEAAFWKRCSLDPPETFTEKR